MKTGNWRSKSLFLILVSLGALMLNGCGIVGGAIDNFSGLVGLNDTGTVIANRAHIRSSYAVVAADLLEVKRGTKLDILEETDFEKVHWYRVRADDEDKTEGWIEAQNIITGTLLEKSKKLAEEDKDLQPQATAQLRAASNLRLSTDLNEENLLFKLDSGSTFDIIGWKYVPKAQEAADVDDASKSSNKQTKAGKTKNADVEAAKEDNSPEDLTDKYDIWYKVRLDPSVSPAPIGWVFGRQVVLQVPNDIVYYQSETKKFVTWQRADAVESDKTGSKDSAARTTKPGSWVILTRSSFVKSKDGNEPDFDGILVLGYDKYNEEHYTVYRNDNVMGKIPLRIDGTGDNKTFTVKIQNAAGQLEDKRFVLLKDAKGRLRVTAPTDLPTK